MVLLAVKACNINDCNDPIGCLFRVIKVTFARDSTMSLQPKWFLGCLWLRSRIRTHNELLGQNSSWLWTCLITFFSSDH